MPNQPNLQRARRARRDHRIEVGDEDVYRPSREMWLCMAMMLFILIIIILKCLRSHEVLCEDLVSSKGFTYQVPHDMTVYLRDRHCEHGWSHANGTFIADSTINGNKFGPFVDVTPENLTVSTCANIEWQIHCDNIQFRCTISYTVKLRATYNSMPGNYTFPDSKEANSPKWRTAVIVASGVVFVIILSVAIWFLGKKCVRKPKYTPPGEGESEAEDSEL